MTQPFKGFPPGKTRTTKIPNAFFGDLLPAIDDLVELKLTLYCFWALQQQEGDLRYVAGRDVLRDQQFLSGIDSDPERAQEQVKAAFERAVARGTLLYVTVDAVGGMLDLYFMNTVHGRNAVQAIREGRYHPGDHDCPVVLVAERPNIFALYEQNIGPLTPMIGDQLREAEHDFSTGWIEEAIRLAVENNKRNWRYVLAILKRWQAEGKDGGLTQQPTQADRYRYIQGEYADFIDY